MKQRNPSVIQSTRIDYFAENFQKAVEKKLKLIIQKGQKEITFEKDNLKWLIQGTEAAFLNIQNEYETKKIPFLINLYANLIFENMDYLVASKIIRLAQELTYQQMLIISCIALHAESKPLTTKNLTKGLDDDLKAYSITSDLMELNHKGIVHTNGMLIDINNFVSSALYLKGCGDKLYNCLELNNIDHDKDYKEIEEFFL